MRSICVSLLMLVAVVSPAFTQTSVGRIAGTVFNSENGDALIGATVMIVGTTFGGTTDIDGKFLLTNVPVGIHTVRVSYIGFVAKTISDVISTPHGVTKL